MKNKSLSHARWKCQYHIVLCKNIEKVMYTGIIPAMYYNYDMQEIYEKETDKYALVESMRHVQNLCHYRNLQINCKLVRSLRKDYH